MRSLGVLLLVSSTAAADPPDPSITADGATIIVPYEATDGARSPPNLRLFVMERSGKIRKTIDVIDIDKGPVPGGAAAKARLYADTKPLPMTSLTPTVVNAEDTHREYVDLAIDLSTTGTLAIRPKGRPAVFRSNAGWRTKPAAAEAARIAKRLDAGELACFNPAAIGPVWIDAKRRVAVVYVRYRGSDSCWEPTAEFAVIAW